MCREHEHRVCTASLFVCPRRCDGVRRPSIFPSLVYRFGSRLVMRRFLHSSALAACRRIIHHVWLRSAASRARCSAAGSRRHPATHAQAIAASPPPSLAAQASPPPGAVEAAEAAVQLQHRRESHTGFVHRRSSCSTAAAADLSALASDLTRSLLLSVFVAVRTATMRIAHDAIDAQRRRRRSRARPTQQHPQQSSRVQQLRLRARVNPLSLILRARRTGDASCAATTIGRRGQRAVTAAAAD